MSQLEVSQNSSPLYSYTFAALGTGGAPAGTQVSSNVIANKVQNLYQSCSKIVGIVRTTSGGVVGQPLVKIETAANSVASGFLALLSISSTLNTDASVYTVYWTNEVAPSQLQTILPC